MEVIQEAVLEKGNLRYATTILNSIKYAIDRKVQCVRKLL